MSGMLFIRLMEMSKNIDHSREKIAVEKVVVHITWIAIIIGLLTWILSLI